MVAKINHYVLFFDTNVLRGGPDYYAHYSLTETLNQLKAIEVVKIELMLPEVVRDEWCRNFSLIAEERQNQVDKSTKYLVGMGVLSDMFSKREETALLKAGEEYLQNLGFDFIDTPYDTIDFAELTKRAIRHTPPFEAKTDKGYKDGLIAHTIKSWTDDASPTENQQVVLVTDDGRLTEYVNELFPDSERLHVCKDLDDLKNYIELSVNQLSNQLAGEAGVLFFTSGSRSIFQKEELGRKLSEFYDKYFPDAEEAKKYLESMPFENEFSMLPSVSLGDVYEFGERSFNLGSTTFVKRDNNQLTWLSGITLVQEYSVTNPNMGMVLHDNTRALNHNVFFEYLWTADLKNGKLTNPHILRRIPRNDTKSRVLLWRSTPIAPPTSSGLSTQLSGTHSLLPSFESRITISDNSVFAPTLGGNANRKSFWE